MSLEKQMTAVVEKELPLHVQNILWYMLERRKCHDELHYFDLDITANEDGQPMQKIVHKYQKNHLYHDKAPITTRVVIKVEGTGTQIMMLLDELETATKNV